MQGGGGRLKSVMLKNKTPKSSRGKCGGGFPTPVPVPTTGEGGLGASPAVRSGRNYRVYAFLTYKFRCLESVFVN